MSKLTDITKDLFSRALLTKRVAALTGGTSKVDSLVITNAGTGYTSAPTVAFSGGGGSGAAATATVANGIGVAIAMTNLGSGYTSVPTVGFSGGGGTGAAATAIMSPTTLDAIKTVDKTAGEFLAIIGIGTELNAYALVAGTDAESSPDVIRPDDYATTTNEKVWKRRTWAPATVPNQGLFDFFADAGNSGSGLTDLSNYSVAANSLAANGYKVIAKYAGIFAATLNNKQLKVDFAGTVIFDSGSLAITSATSWEIEVTIIRSGSSTGRASVKVESSSATLAASALETDLTGLSWTGANALKLQGQGTATNDIVAKLGYGQLVPAA